MAATPPGGSSPPRDPATGKPDKPPRAPNFTDEETDTIIAYMADHEAALISRSTSQARRAALWCDLQQQVNALGVHRRTVPEIKKRWQDVKRRAKEKLASRRREALATGGGPSTQEELTPQEEAATQLINPLAVYGIGGLDTSAPAEAVAELQSQSPVLDDDDGPPPLEGEEGDPDLEGPPSAPLRQSTPAAELPYVAGAPAPGAQPGAMPAVSAGPQTPAAVDAPMPGAADLRERPAGPGARRAARPHPYSPMAPRARRNVRHAEWEDRMESHQVHARSTMSAIRSALRTGLQSIETGMVAGLRAMATGMSEGLMAIGTNIAAEGRARALEASQQREARAQEHAEHMAAIAGLTSVLAQWVSQQQQQRPPVAEDTPARGEEQPPDPWSADVGTPTTVSPPPADMEAPLDMTVRAAARGLQPAVSCTAPSPNTIAVEGMVSHVPGTSGEGLPPAAPLAERHVVERLEVLPPAPAETPPAPSAPQARAPQEEVPRRRSSRLQRH